MYYSNDFEFYWLRKNIIAGSSRPQSIDNIKFIIDQGINHIISISKPTLIQKIAGNLPIEIIPLEFADFGIPTQSQIEFFLSIMQKSMRQHTPVLIHCFMGCGRTGILLTAFLMKFEQKDWITSLNEVRKVRACAVESSNQMDYLSTLVV